MANNCFNYIDITGSINQINEVHNLLKENQEDGFIRFEKVLKREINDFYGEIGTSYLEVDMTLENEILSLSGDSGWSPALEFFKELSQKFPKLNIEYDYEESGCDFGGWAIIQNGIIEDNSYSFWEYKFIRDEIFAMESATEEAEYILEAEGLEELMKSDIIKYMPKEMVNEFIENVKKINKELLE